MADTTTNYLTIANFYDECLDRHGATPQGVDWPNVADLDKRFDVMLGMTANDTNRPISLLDLGCGYGALVNYLIKTKLNDKFLYTGIDVSQKMVNKANELFPNHSFITRDILKDPLPAASVDYVVMNGLLTEKRELPWNDMVMFAQQIIKAAFDTCRKGIAFNIMSQQVDWCAPHLFHWSFDDVAAFVFSKCSRHVIFRNDYGLYEYTVYVYRTAS